MSRRKSGTNERTLRGVLWLLVIVMGMPIYGCRLLVAGRGGFQKMLGLLLCIVGLIMWTLIV